MAVHHEVLLAARRLGRERGDWRFSAADVVRSLPHLNEHSVRTHVASRCCVNAPANHPHRWAYFRRVSRGLYEVTPRYRAAGAGSRASVGGHARTPAAAVAEGGKPYGRRPEAAVGDTIHAVLRHTPPWYVAECLEVAVVTQGKTADEVLANLRDAIALHLEGEPAGSFGLGRNPRLVVTHEIPLAPHGAAT